MRQCKAERTNVGQRLLPGEIPGLDTLFHHVAAGGSPCLQERADGARILFLVAGAGTIEAAARYDGLDLLEIVAVFGAPRTSGESGVFLPYGRCPAYRESIKSEATVSRTVVPETLIPRFCMGSVATAGPDEVGAHAHPMLEQLFFGLPGNDCTIRTDGKETSFGELVLLHIPRGSLPGAVIAPRKRLRYLWMDAFLGDDMSYITATHRTVDAGEAQ